MLHYDCNNACTLLIQHHDDATIWVVVIDFFLKMGDKTGIFKRNMQFLKI